MVPVRLELENFLSYGTEAPPLEFEDFEVACLSGRNGQGKSALLDAITWSVWGEARKSSGKRKPDDELIRIGTQDMEVAFTFDLEGERYRVTRSFHRSSTGRTTTSDLEFQLYEPETEDFRPLTGSTQRETQQRIEDTIGLDYDTFINSAFLLQGRSDEFTKKSPSQRKEILVNILNLSRYERLAGRARDRWRAAKEEVQRTEGEIERLQDALSDVDAWKERREEIEAEIEAKQEALDELRAEEKRLTERKADLEAKAREAEKVRSSIQDLRERIAEHRAEVEALDEKIEEAEALLEKRDEIQRRHDRYEELLEERNELDEKRDLHRGIEKQIEQKESQLRDEKNRLEKRLDRLEVEKKNFEQNLSDVTSKVSQRSSVREHLKEAMAARQTFREMAAVRDRREELKDQITSIEQSLVGARQELKGELEALHSQIEQEKEVAQSISDLKQTIRRLEEKKERRDELQAELQQIETEGKKVSQALQERAGQVEARREELERQHEKLDSLGAVGDGEAGGTCPTCGTELTPSHREQVADRLQQSIDDLQQSIHREEQWMQAKKEKRSELRRSYQETREELDALEEVPEQLATAREQLRAAKQTAEALEEHREQARALEKKLETKSYGAEQRERRQALKKKLRELTFDAKEFEAVQNLAAQVDRYQERLRDLEELDGRRTELQRKIEQHEERMQEIRRQLDDGSAFGDLPDKIDQLRDQLDRIDFDPDRFQKVRAELDDLKDAGAQMKDLVNAQKNREDWKSQRETVRERIADAEEEKDELEDQLVALTEALDGKDELEAKQQAKAEEVREAEDELNDLQQSLGQLTERLDQAEQDRAELQEVKERREEAKKQRTLYKHLRSAFSKNGIPSLIIEETLPEIEERANVLLDRLTDGKMHVRLETLKEKKSGGTKETLEIVITDEQGVARPYETFSGGESFRVNFALRIALAQLLAERSGVRVRTLVIDEGFGTQDEEGIERLVDSIQAIREDFSKILVITHLERLKQAFPVRIEVEKDPVTGSTFDVVGT
jgi:exonuclease SbcC